MRDAKRLVTGLKFLTKEASQLLIWRRRRQQNIITSQGLEIHNLAFILVPTGPVILFSPEFMLVFASASMWCRVPGGAVLHGAEHILKWRAKESNQTEACFTCAFSSSYKTVTGRAGCHIQAASAWFCHHSHIGFVLPWHSSDFGHFTVALYVRTLTADMEMPDWGWQRVLTFTPQWAAWIRRLGT